MTNYKTFNEIQKGDILYGVEVSNIDIKFKQIKVIDIDDYFSTDSVIEIYIDDSPLMFSFSRNKSSWMKSIFTTKEEAIESAKHQINDKIKEFSEQIVYFSNKLSNIDDIEFRQNKMEKL